MVAIMSGQFDPFEKLSVLAARYLDERSVERLLVPETLAEAGTLVLLGDRLRDQHANVAVAYLAVAGVVFLARSEHLQNRRSDADFHAAIFLFSVVYAVEPRLVPEHLLAQFKVLPPKLPPRHDVTHAAGAALMDEYGRTATERRLLENALLLFQRAVEVMPPGHLDQRVIQANLGCTLYARFVQSQSLDDLTGSIVSLRRAFEAGAAELPARADLWTTFARGLKARFELLNDWEDLDNAVQAYCEAVTPPPVSWTGNVRQGELARDFQEETREAAPTPQALVTWFELGALAWARFGLRKDARDLELSIEAFRTTVAHLPQDQPVRAGNLSALANALLERYRLFGEGRDIDEAVDVSDAAVAACPPNSPILDALASNRAAMQAYQAQAHSESEPLSPGSALSNKGLQLQETGQWCEAVRCFAEVLQLLRAAGDRLNEARTLNNLGTTYRFVSRFAEAAEHHQAALLILRDLGDAATAARVKSNLGVDYRELGRIDDALRTLGQAMEELRAAGDAQGEATTLYALGETYGGLGRVDEAIGCFERSAGLFALLGDDVRSKEAQRHLTVIKSVGRAT